MTSATATDLPALDASARQAGGATRYPFLDVARIAAAGSVYFFHSHLPGFEWGYIGVDFFMVLSGFVVTLSIIGRPVAHSPARFIVNRLSRLVPGMVLFLVISVVVLLLASTFSERLQMSGYILPSGLYYSNWYSVFAGDNYFNLNNTNIFIHIWSLAVEEQFYIVFAALLLLPFGFRVGAKVVFLMGLTVLALYIYSTQTADRFYFGTDVRAIQFLAGSLLAYLARRWPEMLKPIPAVVCFAAAAVSVIFAAYVCRDYDQYFITGFALSTLSAIMVLLVSVRMYGIAGPDTRILGQLGIASYSQYLFHMAVLYVLEKFTAYGILEIAVGYAALLLISYVSSTFIEVPAQRYFRKKPALVSLLSLPSILLVVSIGAYAVVIQSVPKPVRDSDLSTGYYFCPDEVPHCVRSGEASDKIILLLSDSVGSASLDGALSQYAKAYEGVGFVTVALPNCAIRSTLTVGWNGEVHWKHRQCQDKLIDNFKSALDTYDVKMAIISSSTDAYPIISPSGDGSLEPGSAEWFELAEEGVQDILVALRARDIEVGFAMPPQAVASMECFETGSGCSMARRVDTNIETLYRRIVSDTPGTYLANLNDPLCSQTECDLVIDGMITRYDGTHFTRAAAIANAEEIAKTLELDRRLRGAEE